MKDPLSIPFLLVDFGKFLQELLLALREVGRSPDDDPHDLVSMAMPLQSRESGLLDGERFTRLGPLGYGEHVCAVEGRDLDFSAERCLDKGDGNLAEDVIPVAFEEWVLFYNQVHVEVSRGTAVHSPFPGAGDPELASVIDPGRDGDAQCGLHGNDPAAMAFRAGMLDDFARSAALGTGGLDTDESLGVDDLPLSLAQGTVDGGCAGLRTLPVAGGAGFVPFDLDLCLQAGCRIPEFHFQCLLDIRSPAGPCVSGPPAEAEAEKVVEYVAEASEDIGGEVVEAEAAESGALEARMAVLVIHVPFPWVTQDLVSLGSLLEFFLCLLVAPVAVRMVFECGLTVCLFDLFLGCIPGNTKNFVVILFYHRRVPDPCKIDVGCRHAGCIRNASWRSPIV